MSTLLKLDNPPVVDVALGAARHGVIDILELLRQNGTNAGLSGTHGDRSGALGFCRSDALIAAKTPRYSADTTFIPLRILRVF